MPKDTNTGNAFVRLAEMGYPRTVPVIPPDATISAGSSLHKRIGTTQDGRGKTPGVMGRDGAWFSFDWVPHEPEPHDYERWAAMGAGVGIKTGQGLIAIDADTMDETLAATIRAEVLASFGQLPVRIGRAPKALYLLRCTDDLPYMRIDFGARDARGVPERVEVLTQGRHFVAQGIHPKTGQPYRWEAPIPPRDALPEATAAQITAFLDRLRSILPEASPLHQSGGTGEYDQASLRGDPALVRKAVAALPNDHRFDTRESYLDVGYAIRAAVEDEAEAFEIFSDWCDRWTEGSNDPEIIAADWNRMKPPYRRGAGWLYDQAEALSGGKFSSAEVWFQQISDEDNPFAAAALNAFTAPDQEAAAAIRATPYAFPEPSAIPRREWLYGFHLIRRFVSATVAPSGVGKSSLIIAEALAMASGRPLLGVEPRGQFKVWLWNGEDPRDELARRIAATMQHYGLTREDVGDRLFVDSGRDMEIVLATETRDGAKISAPVAGAVLETLLANGVDVMQVDPFVSSHRVSENDNGAIDLVSKQWAKIAGAAGCAVDLVHHVRKLNGAEITVEDSRGAVSLIATSRSARALTKMTAGEAAKMGLETERGRLFRFGDGKNNLALPAGAETVWYRLASVGLGNGVGAGLDAVATGDNVGVVTVFQAPEQAPAEGEDRDAILDAIRRGEGRWRSDPRSPDWAGHAVAEALRLDMTDAAEREKAKICLNAFIRNGTLCLETRLDEKRRPRQFVLVAGGGDDIFG